MFKLLDKPLKVKTPNGYKTFTGIQKYTKKTYLLITTIGEIETAELHRFVVDGKEIFAKDLKVDDSLQTETGYTKIKKIIKGPVKDVYDLTNVDGEIYYTNGILSHNTFLGSSATLVSGTALKNIVPMKDEDIIFNSLFDGLKVYQEVKKGHNYILTSDPKQAGIDSIGLHVIDVTNIPFVQVASAKLDESFLVIPNRVYDLGHYYNDAYIVQENNIEANLINVLHDQLEYEGEIFRERKTSGKGFKNIWGIRTTTKTKKMMTSFLKKFVEDGLLEINDKATLDEMFNFIEKKNGTYSAEEGYKDDLVMSLMLVFAPFFDIKNWDNFKGFSSLLEKRAGQQEKEEKETAEFLDLGFAPDDNTTASPFTEGAWDENDFGMDAMEMYQQDMDDRG